MSEPKKDRRKPRSAISKPPAAPRNDTRVEHSTVAAVAAGSGAHAQGTLNIEHFEAHNVVIGAVGVGPATQTSLDSRRDELVAILEDRAAQIRSSLSPLYKYAIVKRYLAQFQDLHARHVESLRKGELIRAHEILRRIGKISCALEADEFWSRHKVETPDVAYCLGEDAFDDGPMIVIYTCGRLSKSEDGDEFMIEEEEEDEDMFQDKAAAHRMSLVLVRTSCSIERVTDLTLVGDIYNTIMIPLGSSR